MDFKFKFWFSKSGLSWTIEATEVSFEGGSGGFVSKSCKAILEVGDSKLAFSFDFPTARGNFDSVLCLFEEECFPLLSFHCFEFDHFQLPSHLSSLGSFDLSQLLRSVCFLLEPAELIHWVFDSSRQLDLDFQGLSNPCFSQSSYKILWTVLITRIKKTYFISNQSSTLFSTDALFQTFNSVSAFSQ